MLLPFCVCYTVMCHFFYFRMHEKCICQPNITQRPGKGGVSTPY